MSDPNKHRYRKLYAKEFAEAESLLVARYGGELVWVDHDYQAFQYRLPDVCLVFYPHKTSAHNFHIRIRDQGSKNKKRAEALLAVINIDSKPSCTFHQKNQWPQIWHSNKKGYIERIRRAAEGHRT